MVEIVCPHRVQPVSSLVLWTNQFHIVRVVLRDDHDALVSSGEPCLVADLGLQVGRVLIVDGVGGIQS